MAYPKAYEPQYGYMYQILVKTPNSREYEHCDYAKNMGDKDNLLFNYRQAYGKGYVFKTIPIPKKYWQVNKLIRKFK